MTSDGSAAAARRRLARLAEQIDLCDSQLAGAPTAAEQRSAVLNSAVAAIQYARQAAAGVFGAMDADAALQVGGALEGLVEAAPKPWGDSALNDLDRIADRSARLLADIWMLGRLTVAADPQSWSNETMVQQCLQVVAETHLAGKLRAELEGMFGSVDEP
jgi:hypothetical protein